MGKKRASSRANEDVEVSRMEKRQKKRQDKGTTSSMVNSNLSGLFKNEDRMQVYNERFKEREILEYKYVDFDNLVKMYEDQNVDVANYLAQHMWTNFVQVHKPVNKVLLRILISNLDEQTMVSWIGKIKVDLSETTWNNTFEMIHVRDDEEEDIMQISKEDVFYRLTGIHNLGIQPFIKINQLHQDANTRLAAQVMMTVLVPKKGSKEQVKIEEGRLLYALIYGKPINLARMIVERLKGACARKSSPICYGMHLMLIMEKAGVDLKCTGTDMAKFNSIIDHHTLKRLGYKLRHGGWDYTGKGKAQADVEEEEATEEEPTQPHPSTTTQPTPPRSRPSSTLSDQITHLQQFIFEQLNLFQAQTHSKLDRMEEKLNSMDSRIQNLEAHLIPPFPPQATHDPTDPKGKRPVESPHPTSPVHIPSHSTSSSSSSSSQTAAQFELAAREPTSPTPKDPTPSSDSEATPSPPIQSTHQPIPKSIPSSLPEPIPSPIPTPPPSPPPQPTQAPSPLPTQPPSPPQPTPQPPPTQAIIIHPTYQRRKLAVTRPKSTTPLVPFPPPSPPTSP